MSDLLKAFFSNLLIVLGTGLIPNKNAPCYSHRAFIKNKSGIDLLSHTVTRIVPSALRGLTSLFGMGRGVTPAI